jgi:hypothetical protein
MGEQSSTNREDREPDRNTACNQVGRRDEDEAGDIMLDAYVIEEIRRRERERPREERPSIELPVPVIPTRGPDDRSPDDRDEGGGGGVVIIVY